MCSNGEPWRLRIRKLMRPRSRISVAAGSSASALARSSVCSPCVDTRAAKSTSLSEALPRTSSTVMSLRKLGSSSLTGHDHIQGPRQRPTYPGEVAVAVIVIVAVLAAAVVGLAWRRGDGALRQGTGERIRPSEAALPDDAFGPTATLL